MSFTKTIKEECARNERDDRDILLAELAAIIRINGTILVPFFEMKGIRFNTSNYSTARRIFYLLKKVTGKDATLSQVQRGTIHKKTIEIELDDAMATRSLLLEIGLMDEQNNFVDKVPSKLLWGSNRSRAFLRGAFLMAGYLSSPEKSHHLELEVPSADAAKLIGRVMKKFDLVPKVQEKKDSVVLYVKDGDQIAKFLSLIEAFQSLLVFEDARALKDMRNQINRKINFETANLDKTVSAAMRQVKLIEELKKEGGFRYLAPELKELAHLRIVNPQATLKELGEMSQPPLSKSAVNHRLRKLVQIAENYFEK